MSSRPAVSFNFVDFWPNFSAENSPFFELLRSSFSVTLSDSPDIVVYSVFGERHRSYKCPKIFYSGECVRPNFDECDFAFTYDHLDDRRHCRLPLYTFFGADKLAQPKGPFPICTAEKSEFCCFIVSEPKCSERNEFFLLLSRYKKVHSGGRFMNNIGGPIPRLVEGRSGKLEFMKQFKFAICFENESYPGYTSEKLVQAMRVNTIPIYWGNPLVGREFNTKSFINCHEFASFEDVITRVIEVDQNQELYRQMMMEPWFIDGRMPDWVDPVKVRHKLCEVVEDLLGLNSSTGNKSPFGA